ncbi:MAG TPA: hypothetical protein PKD90_02330 [Phnomibacter sp.]|nr:hypothetical protein [Phnomibacter sp.]
MKNKVTIIAILAIVALAITACKKRFADPTYAPAGGSAVRTWYKTDPFYSPQAEYLQSNGTWRSFISFPLVYDNDPNKLGFGHPWLEGRGSNALGIRTLYGGLPGGITSDSGYYMITIPKCFEFIPDSKDAVTGDVNVIPQKITIYRINKSTYQLGISGKGRYNTEAKLFEVEIIFDETEIGGPKDLKRQYRFRP